MENTIFGGSGNFLINACRFEPVEDRHRNVEDDQIREKRPGRLDSRLAIGYRRDDVKLGLEQGGDLLTHFCVIVRYENARFGHVREFYATTNRPRPRQ